MRWEILKSAWRESSLWAQTKILLKKNFLTFARRRGSTLAYLASPILVCLVLICLQLISNIVIDQELPNGGPWQPIDKIPKCFSRDNIECKTVIYSPTNLPWLNDIMKEVSEKNNLEFNKDVVPLPGADNTIQHDNATLINYLVNNPNTTQLALFVHTAYLPSFNDPHKIPDNFGYVLYANHTRTSLRESQFPLHKSLQQVLLARRSGNRTVSIDARWKVFPRAVLRVAGYDVVGANGSQWFFIPPMIVFLLLLVEITTEKEKKLRLGMKVMGLQATAYWFVWLVTGIIWSTLITLILIGTGAACQFSYFLNTNFFVNFLLFFLFTLSLCSLAFFCSTLLKRASTAQTTGYAIILIGFIFQAILATGYGLLVDLLYLPSIPGWVSTMRVLLKLYPPYNMAQAFANIAALSTNEIDVAKGAVVKAVGFTWADLFKTRELPKILGFNIIVPPTIESFYLMILNFFVFLVLALIIDVVWPNDGTGVRNPFRMIKNGVLRFVKFMRLFCANSQSFDAINDDNDDFFGDNQPLLLNDSIEKSNLNVNKGVQLFKLCKTYRTCRGESVQAVRNVSLSFEAGQITCLLGPNGAGKTTLIQTMLGLLQPSAGSMRFFGRTSIDSLRSRVGVCPQHDILFDKLTAREHLLLFGRLKGGSNGLAAEAVSLLTKVDLLDVADNTVDTYSGGMRRRLSVAIAAIGDPLVLFLDEFTTGMDTVHRSQVWRIIEDLKKDRVVVLTTHSMEEADVLGDRVAIMTDGSVQCNDSPIALKNQFGSGWRVSVDDSPALRDAVRALAPDATLSFSATTSADHDNDNDDDDNERPLDDVIISAKGHNNKLVIGLARDKADTLIKVTRLLESRHEKFVVKQSGLDDVFRNVTSAAGFKYASLGDLPLPTAATHKRGSPSPYRANFLKNFTLQWRQKGTNLCQFMTPVIMILTIVLLQAILQSQLGVSENETVVVPAFALPLNTPLSYIREQIKERYGYDVPVPWLGVTSSDDDCIQYFVGADLTGHNDNRRLPPSFGCSCCKDASCCKSKAERSKCGPFSRISQYTCEAHRIGWYQQRAPCGKPLSHFDRHRAAVPYVEPFASADAMDACIYDTSALFNNIKLKTLYEPKWLYYMPDAMIVLKKFSHSLNSTELSYDFSVNDSPIVQYHRRNNFTRIHVDRHNLEERYGTVPPLASQINAHSLVPDQARVAVMDALFKSVDAVINDKERDALFNTNFVGQMPQNKKFSIIGVLHAYGVVLFPIALSLQLPIYIFNFVLEKSTKLRGHMQAHGMRLLPYFVTHFVFNILLFLVSCSCLWISGALAGIPLFSVTAPSIMIAFFVGWGLSLVSMAFVSASLLTTPRAASVFGYVVALFGSLIGIVICAGIYGSIPFIGNNQRLPVWLLAYPQFAMVRGIYLLNHSCNHNKECYNGLPSPNDEMAVVLASLYLSALVYGLLGLLLDVGVRRLAAWRVGRPDAAVSVKKPVGEELQIVDDSFGSGRYVSPLRIDRLTKRYRGATRCAVNNLSLNVTRGEVIALCGANGAGKSTLLSMLTGLLQPTSGDARVCGHSIVNEMTKVHHHTGLCTQFDILWEDLTVYETLMFYCRLKGISWRQEKEHVCNLLHELGLFDARNRKPSQLSGGMRRRLSIGVALVGQSSIVFLDEPSTGLDIVSRANVWQIIERVGVSRGTSMLLTTHSFDEATRLADRIAIMHKGDLRACDTIDNLIATAGRHYALRVSFEPADGDAVLADVHAFAPHAVMQRKFERSASFAIAKSSDDGKAWAFSNLFESLVQSEHISAFTLTDVGLTQIFESIVLEKDMQSYFSSESDINVQNTQVEVEIK